MIAFKLAYKNLIGAGLRTLLIVFVLSLAYVLIIYMNGIYRDGTGRPGSKPSPGKLQRDSTGRKSMTPMMP